ncbi:MAG: hypothetical protein JXQ82_08250 [Methanomicrobiaceae archaeon]|nr:hypothetical protein [Methanomicrobiaceae archaeon]
MKNHKSIEEAFYGYLKSYSKKTRIIEAGIGKNPHIAQKLKDEGYDIRACDIKENLPDCGILIKTDDIFEPDLNFYKGADLIYSVRPGIEMIPPLIAIAKNVKAELIVYHLGNEIYENGGEIINCGVILHRYYKHDR